MRRIWCLLGQKYEGDSRGEMQGWGKKTTCKECVREDMEMLGLDHEWAILGDV